MRPTRLHAGCLRRMARLSSRVFVATAMIVMALVPTQPLASSPSSEAEDSHRSARASTSGRTDSRQLYRGTLSRRGERLLLVPCGTNRTLRVWDVSPEVIITAAITDIGFDRLPSLYLEAFGRLKDGELMIDRLNRAGTEMACPSTRIGLRAQGNEPGWQLQTGPGGVRFSRQGQTSLHAPGGTLSWHWPDGGQHRAHATLEVLAQGQALSAELTPRICRDSMADAVYGFTAVVRRRQPAETLRGCAFLGSEPMPD